MISDDINISPRPLCLQRFCLKRRHHISTAEQNDVIKQNRALSSGCHTVARRLPLTASLRPLIFHKTLLPPLQLSHPYHPSERSPASKTSFSRLLFASLTTRLIDLSARSPTGPVELRLLIWTPASCAVKQQLSVCLKNLPPIVTCTAVTPHSRKALKWNTEREYFRVSLML